MNVAIGFDHAGFALKEIIVQTIKEMGHEVVDCGVSSCRRADYPDYADKVARLVSSGKVQRGILTCGSGVGMCVCANKVKGVRACVCHDAYSARQAVEHDALNVLCLGARIIGPAVAQELVQQFLNASFLTGTRHEVRLNKIIAIEDKNFK